MTDVIDLTVVIPAYNEQARLPMTLRQVVSWLEQQPRRSEIIVVDDGSTDRTREIADASIASSMINIRVLVNDANRGKGYSVKRGMREARGRAILFTDADLSTPIECAVDLLSAIDAGAHIAVGSRQLPDSAIDQHQPVLRESAGRAFSVLQRVILGTGIRDTQCGFKVFTRQARELVLPRQTIDGWGFDAELLFIAHRLGLHVAEVPVIWSNSAATKVNAFTDGITMVCDLIRIRRVHHGLQPLGHFDCSQR